MTEISQNTNVYLFIWIIVIRFLPDLERPMVVAAVVAEGGRRSEVTVHTCFTLTQRLSLGFFLHRSFRWTTYFMTSRTQGSSAGTQSVLPCLVHRTVASIEQPFPLDCCLKSTILRLSMVLFLKLKQQSMGIWANVTERQRGYRLVTLGDTVDVF